MTADSIAPDSISLSPDQARDILLRYYGIEAVTLKLMDSELSSVYRVLLADGRSCAFKALPFTDDALATTAWRVEAMEHLQDLGIPAGASYLSKSGESVIVARTPGGASIVHVGQWLSGTPLEFAEATPVLMRAVGSTAAAVVEALSLWPAPPVQIAHPWELTRTLTSIAATIDLAATPEDRALLSEASERFRTHVHEQLSTLPHAAIHHDMHDSNLLVDAGSGRVTGVLDFGDMVWGPRVADLAVAAGYGCRNSADPLSAYLEIIAGWGTRVKLEPSEIDVLFAASTGRLAVNLGVWSARANSDRGEYARARSASSAHALSALFAADFEAVQKEVRARLLVA